MYDIANVLASLQLIEKIHIVSSRRPAFKWRGADVFDLTSSVDDSAFTRDQPVKASTLPTPNKNSKSSTSNKVKSEKPEHKLNKLSTASIVAAAAAAAGGGAHGLLTDPFSEDYAPYHHPSNLSAFGGGGGNHTVKRSNSSLLHDLPLQPHMSSSFASVGSLMHSHALYGANRSSRDKENQHPNLNRDVSMPLLARKGTKTYEFSMDTLNPLELAYLTTSAQASGERHPSCIPPPPQNGTGSTTSGSGANQQPPLIGSLHRTNTISGKPGGAGGSDSDHSGNLSRLILAPSRTSSFTGILAIADPHALPIAAVPLQYISPTSVAGATAKLNPSTLPSAPLMQSYGSALGAWEWSLPQLREIASTAFEPGTAGTGNATLSTVADRSTPVPPGGGAAPAAAEYTAADDADNEVCVSLAQDLTQPLVSHVPSTSLTATAPVDSRSDSQVADEFLVS